MTDKCAYEEASERYDKRCVVSRPLSRVRGPARLSRLWLGGSLSPLLRNMQRTRTRGLAPTPQPHSPPRLWLCARLLL